MDAEMIKTLGGMSEKLDSLFKEFKGFDGALTYKEMQDSVADLKKEVEEYKNAVGAIQLQQKKAEWNTSGELSPEFKGMLSYICKNDAATIGNPSSMGYLSPHEFVAKVQEKLYATSPLMQEATVLTVKGDIADIPVETGQADIHWVGETESRSSMKDAPTLKQAQIPVNTIISRIPVSNKLLRSSAINLESYLVDVVGKRISRAVGSALTNGDGFKKPLGIFKDEGITAKASGNASAISLDNLYEMYGYLDNVENGKYYMSKSTLAYLAKLKGSDNYYLQPAVAAGLPPTFAGCPIVCLTDAPSVSANNYAVIYGDMQNAYTVADGGDLYYRRDEDSKWDDGMTVLKFAKYVGGQVIQPSSLVRLKVASSL